MKKLQQFPICGVYDSEGQNPDPSVVQQEFIGGIEVTESSLIAELKSGDESVLYKIVGEVLCAQDIEELCSDVFYRLWLHRENLDERFGIKPYLSVCAKNAVKNRLRQLKRPPDDIDELDIPSEFSVEKAAELHEMMEQLNGALAELSEEEREIFLRYFFYGEKTADISEAMEINENTARSKLSRTRNKLRDYLKQRGFDYV